MTESVQPGAELREGRITSIRAQKKAPERVSVYVDGAFAFGIHRDVLLEFELAKGTELTVDEQVAILERDAYFRARAVAFRYLSYRERSAEEIRRRLRRDRYPDTIIEDVIHHLERSGYVDDHRYARAYAEGRFQSRGHGPMRIRADLRRRGVSSAAIDAAVEHISRDRDELLEAARRLAAKRWAQLSGEPDLLKRKKKVYDFLGRRGFAFDMARRVVEELAASQS